MNHNSYYYRSRFVPIPANAGNFYGNLPDAYIHSRPTNLFLLDFV